MNFTFNPLQAVVMTYSHAKRQSIQNIENMQTGVRADGRSDRGTEAIALSDLLMRLVTKTNLHRKTEINLAPDSSPSGNQECIMGNSYAQR